MKFFITCQYLGVQNRIYFHRILFDQFTGSLKISFTFNALYLSQQLSEQSVLLGKEGAVPIDPVKVEHVTESTGAGDSYIGAFAYGKYKGMTDLQACRFAARAASVTVTKIGAQEAMPCLNEIN